ncbi:hypothetical protein DFH09DRAFT_1108760 [Mycena vulgaris]|nr:hypothetical protein DFH09DRAFT_1108760 [Mycena vulgaris]
MLKSDEISGEKQDNRDTVHWGLEQYKGALKVKAKIWLYDMCRKMPKSPLPDSQLDWMEFRHTGQVSQYRRLCLLAPGINPNHPELSEESPILSRGSKSPQIGNFLAAPSVLLLAHTRQDADRVVRAVDTLIVQDLFEAGKGRAASNSLRRVAPTFGQRNPSRFPEVPKEMPIQYYDAVWFNNRPPQARDKLAPNLIVAFIPGSSDFFSRRSDNALSVKELTEKYGAQVFADYELDYGKAGGEQEESGANGRDAGPDANSDDSGESVGAHNSDDEQSIADNESMGSFLSDDEVEGEEEFGSEGENAGGSADEQDVGSEDDDSPRAAFAATYNIPMEDLATEIFGGSGDSDESP